MANFGRNIANMWRTSNDICIPGSAPFDRPNGYAGSACRNFDSAEDVWWNQGPGTWNDMDMLVVGMDGITDLQSQTLMNMWCVRGAPLIIGCNVVTAPQNIIDILENREVIAVDQDALCAQGRKVREDQPGVQVYSKPLGRYTSGDRAVLLLNRSAKPADVTVYWSDLGLTPHSASLRDIVLHKDLGSFKSSYTVKQLAPYGSVFLKITGGDFDWSRPRDYEAESVLNTFSGTARYHAFATGFSANGMVDGIGAGPANTLRFNQVDAPSNGQYVLTISYGSQLPPGMDTGDQESVDVTIDGGKPVSMELPRPDAAAQVLSVSAVVKLNQGFNTIQLSNPLTAVPAIDKLTVQGP